jgi:hypothetical protein
MLPPTAVTGIAAALGGYANGSRDALPRLQFEIIYEYAPKNGPKELEFSLIHDARFAHPASSDEQLPEQIGLVEFLDRLTATAPRWLPEQQRDARFTIFGFLLIFDEPLTAPADHDADDRRLDPAVTRAVLAIDVDGRRYEMLVGAGHPSPSVQISEPGTPLPNDADSPNLRNRRAALTTLAHLAEAAAAMPALQPAADSDSAEEDDRDVLVAGELVTVTGDRFDDDQRKQLWVVVDAFFDYTIAVLGGDGYQWGHIPRSELTPVTPQWIRRVIRGDRTFGYVGADSTDPVLLDDEFYQRQPGRYELTRVYQLAGQVLRVRVHRQPEPEQSRAEAQVLNPTGGFTLVADTPPADWHPATPTSAQSGEPLYPIAEQLLHRAARILTPPADPATTAADS